MNELMILLSTGMTGHDAEKALRDGVQISKLSDTIENSEYFSSIYEDEEEFKNFIDFLQTGKVGSRLDDCEITEYNHVKYFICYCL